MGLIELSNIPHWKESGREERDRAVPIGTIRVQEPVTLTRVFVNGAGVPDFGEEESGFLVWQGRPLDVRAKDTPPADAIRLLTMEVATPERSYLDQTVFIAMRPSSADWFASAPFKSVKHGSDARIRQLLEAATEAAGSRETALWARLKEMKTDPFGNEETVYARFRLLNRTDTLVAEEYCEPSDQLTVNDGKPNRALRDPELAFSVCTKAQQICTALDTSRLLGESLEYAQQGCGRDYRGSPKPLGATATSLATPLMAAAKMKALAGCGSKVMESLRRDRRCAEAGPVAVLASRIFEDDLRNLQRRNEDEPKIMFKPEGEPRFRAPAPLKASCFSQSDVIAMVEKASREIPKKLDDPVAVFRALMVQLDPNGQDTPERTARLQRACVRAAALDASGYELPDFIIARLTELRLEFPPFVTAAIGSCMDEEKQANA